MTKSKIPLYNAPVIRGEGGQAPAFYGIVDNNIRIVNYTSEDPYITPLLDAMKLGLKETASIMFPKEFSFAYKVKYSK